MNTTDLRNLRQEAAVAGDYITIVLCDVALGAWDPDTAPAHLVEASRHVHTDDSDVAWSLAAALLAEDSL